MLTRREMLQRSALLSLTPLVPSFLARTARAATAESDRRVLVVIQMEGGNDGLNTVVPFRDENYARLRPKLKLNPDQLVKLNDEVGLHPSMRPAGKLFESRRLAVVQCVGYPNPNRSHFESMAIWQSANLDVAQQGQSGWLGRALDVNSAKEVGPHAVYVGPGTTPVTLWGRRSTVAALKSLDEMALSAPADFLRDAAKSDGNAAELTRTVADTETDAFTTAERLAAMSAQAKRPGGSPYPPSKLGEQLKLVSALLHSGSRARVFYTSQAGYDTHAGQANSHFQLLGELAAALKAFVDDLSAKGLADRVLVMTFSEFGRRAAENGSEGTDHGAAGPVFLAGPEFASGVLGPTPNLSDLQEGDVKMAVDFRQIYSTVLERWLEVSPQEVLAGKFDRLGLFGA